MGGGKYLDVQIRGETENRAPYLGLNRIVQTVLDFIDQQYPIACIAQGKDYAKQAIHTVTECA